MRVSQAVELIAFEQTPLMSIAEQSSANTLESTDSDRDAAASLLSLEGVAVSRGASQLLVGVSFKLASGEGLRIVGANGSGKTSLLRVIAGLAKPAAGTMGGQLHTDDSSFSANSLYLGHLPGLNARLNPLENMLWWLSLHASTELYGKSQTQTTDIARRALLEVGLYEQQLMPSGQLSAGQHRRAALARLFLPEDCLGHKKLWILDEPFTALDQSFSQKLVEKLDRHLWRGGSLILTTHHDIDNLLLAELDLSQFALNQGIGASS